MSDRTTEIVNATNEAIRLTDNWTKSLQRGDTLELPEMIRIALKNMVIVNEIGDTPNDCKEISLAINVFAEELRQYDRKFDGKVNPNGSPVAVFWDKLSKIQELILKTDQVYMEVLEPICDLYEQKVSEDQIAFHIYGRLSQNPYTGQLKPEGPFVTPHGMVNVRLLRQASKSIEEQEKILGKDWYPPWKATVKSSMQQESEKRLQAFRKLAEGPKQNSDPRTVEEMLLEGCYVQTVEQYKQVTRNEVLQACERLGIEPVDQPGWTPKQIVQVPKPQVPAHMQQPGETNGPIDDDVPSANVKDAVIACVSGNPGFGSAEIVDFLAQDGIPTTARQVGAILRELKKTSRVTVGQQ